ncbi:hypothetical protein KJI95_01915 [Shewanella sp. JM162201]|uniref:Branched-chain amino acid transport protein (AzlD) n=1 Tax=Shewanella jiangmenensis TaxID=2837387 RepID=A0ABS5V087_9GAMM|nr:hypothetical protein [Shewanella jiangmenensis]MBT1443285.1 hypothetical protein [Shewanella jiangmenensis]
MYWFIAAIVIASAVFMFAPASPKVTAEVSTKNTTASPALLLVALAVTIWLLATQITADKLLPASLTLAMLATTATLSLTTLRRFMLPTAALTALLLVLNLLQMFFRF